MTATITPLALIQLLHGQLESAVTAAIAEAGSSIHRFIVWISYTVEKFVSINFGMVCKRSLHVDIAVILRVMNTLTGDNMNAFFEDCSFPFEFHSLNHYQWSNLFSLCSLNIVIYYFNSIKTIVDRSWVELDENQFIWVYWRVLMYFVFLFTKKSITKLRAGCTNAS